MAMPDFKAASGKGSTGTAEEQMSRTARERMVERQIAGRGVKDPAVLKAMRVVPREEFVPAGLRNLAYEDSPLSIGEGQTISQPYVVAVMLEAASLRPTNRVLDVGAGSGYAAAVASRIVSQVYTIERHASLAREAHARFERLGYTNIATRIGDGSKGWPDAAPFDAIVVAASAEKVPEALKNQLAMGGRLVIPVEADLRFQRLLRIERIGENTFEETDLGPVLFVPLISGG